MPSLTTLPTPCAHPAFAAARGHALAVAGGVKTTIAGCVAFGLELNQLQIDLGFTQGGQRRGEWEKPALGWKELLPQETGFSYVRCRDFMKTAEAVRQHFLGSKKKADAALRAIVTSPPAVWSAVDYCTFADAIGQHFDAATFNQLMEDLGLGAQPAKQIAPPPPPQEIEDPYSVIRAAHDCVAVPIADLYRTMAAPEEFTRHLYELPLTDQEGDRAAGIPAFTGLLTLSHILAQAQEQLARVIADKKKAKP